MWSPNELLKIEKQRDILSYITLQFFHFKKVPLEHCPFVPPPKETILIYRTSIFDVFSYRYFTCSVNPNSSGRSRE